MRLARSAPAMPGVRAASTRRSTSGASVTLRACTLRMASRPLTSGRSTTTCRSKRPAPQQRGVEHLGPVGGGHDDDALGGVEAVHLGQDLVERLLALVVAAHDPGGARARLADGVQLVDEDDAGRLLLGLLEEVAHPRRAHAHEHLHELGAGEEEEGHVGLARHRPREERLARARRPDQEHALGDAPAEPLVLLRVLEEVHDLHQLRLGLVHAGHVREGGLELARGRRSWPWSGRRRAPGWARRRCGA